MKNTLTLRRVGVRRDEEGKNRQRFYRMFLCQKLAEHARLDSIKVAFLPWRLFVQQHERFLHNLGQKRLEKLRQ